jgi:hypothetical protein
MQLDNYIFGAPKSVMDQLLVILADQPYKVANPIIGAMIQQFTEQEKIAATPPVEAPGDSQAS